jgi:hypothetical protein
MAAMFSLYEVHSWYSHTASFLGISYNTARIDYYYVTGNGIVQSDHYCDASDSGFTGGYSVGWYTNHYVSGGYGHCIATYIQSAYGVVVDTLHQGMTVSGSRVVSTYGPS